MSSRLKVGDTVVTRDPVPTAWFWPVGAALAGAILGLGRRRGAILSMLASMIGVFLVAYDFLVEDARLGVSAAPRGGLFLVLGLLIGAGAWGLSRWWTEQRASNDGQRGPPRGGFP